MTTKECFFKNTCKDYNTAECNAFCRPFMELYAKPKQARLSPFQKKSLRQLVPRETAEEHCVQ